MHTIAVGGQVPWAVQVAIGVALLVAGALVLRVLVRLRVPWWPSVAAPLLFFGPAAVLILGEWWRTGAWLFDARAGTWPTNLGWSVFVFLGATAVFGVVRAFLLSRVVQEELGLRIPSLVLDGVRYLLWVVMIFVVLGTIWGKTEWFTGLLTASAIGTVIIGLALQETLQNFFAGMSLVTERIYAIGDWVWIGDKEGQVVAITRRTTRLRTRSSDYLTIPNRSVTTAIVRNVSKPSPVHAEVLFVQAPYEVPPNRVRETLRRALRDVPGALREPAPLARLVKYADSGIEYQVKFWLDDIGRLDDIRSDVMVQIWYHFARAGIGFPYPVREYRRFAPPAPSGLTPEGLRSRLARTPLFQETGTEVVEGLARGARVDSYAAGEKVVVQGDPGDSCYVVDSGCLEVVVEDGGKSRQVAVLGPGDLFGEMSLLTGEPRTATVRALEDAHLVRVGAGVLKEALERSPDLAHHLAESVALRREGLAAARTALDADATGRVRAATLRLASLIRRFFQLGDRT